MCKTGKAITVTATNFCAPNYNLPNDDDRWCNPPRAHFDMFQPASLNIGIYEVGIIPVVYQHVKWWRSGGVRFSIVGGNYFQVVLVTNIARSGSIKSISVKGSNTGWIHMSRNWGANWQCLSALEKQPLSLASTSTGGQYIVFQNVVPAVWLFGQTFPTWQQFDY
ncbi:hypothetical protein ACQ4PT_000047 [Festuca glaucescens]